MAESQIELDDPEKRVKVHFICQKCSQPLKLDTSFDAIDSSTYNDVTETVYPEHRLKTANILTEPAESVEHEITSEDYCERAIHPTPAQLLESLQDFTLVGETGGKASINLSKQLMTTSALFDKLSGQAEIDHPLCEECTDNLLDILDQELRTADDDYKEYSEFLDNLNHQKAPEASEKLDEELQSLENEIEQLKVELTGIDENRHSWEEKLEKEKQLSHELQKQEDELNSSYNEYKRQLLDYEDAQISVNNQLSYCTRQLDILKQTNGFNATFFIWHDENFGTINGFRLGRLPNIPVDWNEINAAWGQTVLLLHSLASRINLEFKGYKLVPFGNHSYIESLTDKSKELPLYGSGGLRFFWETKFDIAMVSFLDLLQQFKVAVERQATSEFRLPYEIDRGKMIDQTGQAYPIKMQFNSEERWTKALKFVLTDLKWGLAWASAQYGSK